MLIQCPSCGTQAKIPSSKEGAKVRCPSCDHVYVARVRGKKKGSSGDPTKMIIIGAVVVTLVFLVAIASNSSDPPPPPPAPTVEEEKDDTPYVDPMSWDGPLVGLARELQQAAATANEARLNTRLDAESAYSYSPPVAEGDEAGADGSGPNGSSSGDEQPAEARPAWSELDQLARIQWANDHVKAMMTPGPEGAVVAWKPYDGSVVSLEGGIAIVDLRVQPRDASLGLDDRWTRWTLKNLDGESGADDRWRWIRVARHISDAELAAMRNRGRRKAEKKTLSDGSVVYESAIRAIPFDVDTPLEEQQRLSKLVNELVEDADAPPRVRTKVREALIAAGKPAVPALLTRMAEIVEAMPSRPDEDEDDRVRLNWIHEVLRDITGYETTFDVAEAMGGTRERMESGLKQWFAWYDRKYKRFKGLEAAVDPLLDDPDFMPRTAEEQREYNKALREQLEEERRRKDG